MPLYIADYRADTAHLSAAEHGAYLLLIMHYWSTGGLPEDDRQLARIACMTAAQWKNSRSTIAAFFNDGWKHGRIEGELVRSVEVSASYAARASQAAKKRWDKHSTRNASSIATGVLENAQPPSHPQKKERIAADAASSGNGKYAFECGTIRLTAKHFGQWEQAFSFLDLRAELVAIEPWAAQQDSWFNAVAGALAKKNRELKLRSESVRRGQLSLVPTATDGII